MKKAIFLKRCFSFLLLGISLIISPKIVAQRVRASFGFGGSFYNGDLVRGMPQSDDIHPALSIGVSYDLAEQLRTRLNYTYCTISGADRNSTQADFLQRNLDFRSKISEFSLLFEYDFVNSGYKFIVPYVFAGPSVFSFDPTTVYKDTLFHLHDIGTEGQNVSGNFNGKGKSYNLTQLNLQVGAGVRYEVNERLSIGLETSLRGLFTDYLDDVSSGSYIDPKDVATAKFNSLARALSFRGGELDKSNPLRQTEPGYDNYNNPGTWLPSYTLPRGNPNKNDSYYTFQLRVTYRLDNIHIGKDLDFYSYGNPNSKLRCPKSIF